MGFDISILSMFDIVALSGVVVNDSLFEKDDACAGMANYLKFYGWNPGLDGAVQEKVVYHYNHSRPYIRAILGVGERFRQ